MFLHLELLFSSSAAPHSEQHKEPSEIQLCLAWGGEPAKLVQGFLHLSLKILVLATTRKGTMD